MHKTLFFSLGVQLPLRLVTT